MNKMIRRENLVHRVFASAYLLSAVLTVLPNEAASKECRLGYKALCSFTPYGTLILVGLFALHAVLSFSRSSKLNKAD